MCTWPSMAPYGRMMRTCTVPQQESPQRTREFCCRACCIQILSALSRPTTCSGFGRIELAYHTGTSFPGLLRFATLLVLDKFVGTLIRQVFKGIALVAVVSVMQRCV